MRILLSAALIAGVLVPLATLSSAASAADLDYEYGTPPPHYYEPPPPRVYERRAYLPPPVYDRPVVRRYPPHLYGEAEGYGSYRRPYAEAYEDFAYRRPRRPEFEYRPY